jgi:hypothetical protein
MKLNAPNKVSYWAAIVFGMAGIYGELSNDLINQSFLSENRVAFLMIAFIGLAVAPLMRNRFKYYQ